MHKTARLANDGLRESNLLQKIDRILSGGDAFVQPVVKDFRQLRIFGKIERKKFSPQHMLQLDIMSRRNHLRVSANGLKNGFSGSNPLRRIGPPKELIH